MAEIGNGGSCAGVSSTEIGSCTNVIDGLVMFHESKALPCNKNRYLFWMSRSEPHGPWIKIAFSATYQLTHARIMQVFKGKTRLLSLTFDDGSWQKVSVYI